jgi:hypothetical protein
MTRISSILNSWTQFLCGLTFLITLLSISNLGHSQVLDADNIVTVQLSDGMNLTLYGEVAAKGTTAKNYYFLPNSRMLNLTKRQNGTPEFLFMKYTSESKEGASGGILHFLMGWELTADQRTEAEEKIREILGDNSLVVKGAAVLEAPGADEAPSFRIISATLSSDQFTDKVLTSGNAPIMPGGKVAAASNLTPEGAQLLAATFENANSITDISVSLSFAYTVQMPAFKASASFNWSKFRHFVDEQTVKKSSSWWGYKSRTSDIRNQMNTLIENEVITYEFAERLPNDERLDMVREVIISQFLEKLTEPVDNSDESLKVFDEDALKPSGGTWYGWSNHESYRKWTQTDFQQKNTVINLNYSLPVQRTLDITSNVADWYDQVANNPDCISSVNLNDPFFQHRDIHMIIDLTAKDMFESEVNYVTVNVKKKRSDGHDFVDKVTIDQKFLSENGVRATLTYARGEDKNPDLYEYQAQWSMSGGNLYPKNPGWSKGKWEGVTLTPPIKPRHVEVEADIDDLKANEITRVTAQIRYRKFGREIEENIPVSPARGEPLVERDLYIDSNTKGYAYRLIFSHKRLGKMATRWESNILDDYMYAVIPPEWKSSTGNTLLDETTSEIIEAMDNGKTIIQKTEEILDQFSELFN